MGKKIFLITAGFILWLGLSGFAATVSFGVLGGNYDQPPEPRLRYPIYDTVQLTGGRAVRIQLVGRLY